MQNERMIDRDTGTRHDNSIQFVFQNSDGVLHNTFNWNAESQTWCSLIEQTDEQGKWSFFAEDIYQRL